MMQLPHPYVAAYMVGRIRFVVDDYGRVQPVWNSGRPEYVNTVEIEEVLHQPNTFLLSWQEVHYEFKPTQVRDTIINRAAERLITKQHFINLKLLTMMNERYTDAMKTGQAARPIRSYERILLDLGWRFEWMPVGENDEIGAIIPDEIIRRLPEEYEIQLLMEQMTPEQREMILTPDQTRIKAPEPVADFNPAPPPVDKTEERLNRLELLVERIYHTVTSGVKHTDEAPHRLGSRQSHASDVERAEDFRSDREHARPTGVSLPQHGAELSEQQGVVSVGRVPRDDYHGSGQSDVLSDPDLLELRRAFSGYESGNPQ